MAKRKPAAREVVPDQIDRSILIVRGEKVLLDEQLAGFYGVPTKVFVQAIKRNSDRFPGDFMFQLTSEEWGILRSQIVTSSLAGHGGRRYAPVCVHGTGRGDVVQRAA